MRQNRLTPSILSCIISISWISAQASHATEKNEAQSASTAPAESEKKTTHEEAKTKPTFTTPSATVAKKPTHHHKAKHTPSAAVITMMQTLTETYKNNPEIKAGQASLRAIDERVTQALSGWRPRIEASINGTLTKQILSGDQKSGLDRGAFQTSNNGLVTHSADYSVGLKQNLYKGGQTIAQTLVAENEVLATRARLLNDEQRLLLAAATAHIDVIYRRDNLKSLQQYHHNLGESVRSAQEKYQAGEETKTSVSQAEAERQEAQASIDSAIAELETAEAIYYQLTGIRPGNLEPTHAIPGFPESVSQAIETAKQKSPQILEAKHKADSARHKICATRADLLPSVDLSASTTRRDITSRYSINSSNPNNAPAPRGATDYQSHDMTTEHRGTIQVRIPIYEGGEVRSKIRAAREESEASRITIYKTTNDVVKEVAGEWSHYKGGLAAAKMYKAQKTSLADSVAGTRQEMLVGAKILLDVLNEEKKRINAEQRELQAQRNGIVSGYKMLLQTGQLSAKELKLNTPIYDAEVNYKSVRDAWQ